jgi:hypothetical protein
MNVDVLGTAFVEQFAQQTELVAVDRHHFDAVSAQRLQAGEGAL